MENERKVNPFLITTIIFAVTTVIAAALLIWSNVSSRNKAAQAVAEAEETTVNEEEIADIKQEEREELLSDMMTRLTGGEGALSLFKSYFPDKIVYINNAGDYVFADILTELAKNAYSEENFSKDDNGVITYIEDGIVVSHMGVDASRFQGDIDFDKLKEQGVEFAMLRCGFRSYGSGNLNKDAAFDTFAKNARDSGIKIGAYFFSSAITTEEAAEEAQYVLDIIKPYDITYPVVLDFEEISGDTYRQENLTVDELTDIVITFCEAIEKAGYTPMIYSNLKGFVGRLDLTRLEKYEKWFAYYADTPYFPYEFSMWQYSDSGDLDGVSGGVIDLDISFKSY